MNKLHELKAYSKKDVSELVTPAGSEGKPLFEDIEYIYKTLVGVKCVKIKI